MDVTIRVTNTLDDLAADMSAIPPRAQAALPRIVHKNLVKGNRIAQRLAREKAGPHGKNYWKRLSAEMTGPLSGEYGPEGEPKSDFIGVGFRHGVNLDLPNSADQIAPKFADDVLDAADGLFW